MKIPISKTFLLALASAALLQIGSAHAECRPIYVNGKRVVVCTERPGPTYIPNVPVRPKKPGSGRT